jgi:hypothetical protein
VYLRVCAKFITIMDNDAETRRNQDRTMSIFGFNGLNIFGDPTFSQDVFQVAILIVAVALSSLGRMLAEFLVRHAPRPVEVIS